PSGASGGTIHESLPRRRRFPLRRKERIAGLPLPQPRKPPGKCGAIPTELKLPFFRREHPGSLQENAAPF
ncbi:MAG: hypothetical protein D6812_08960, partial [Deltaproteobacteria bacterium]